MPIKINITSLLKGEGGLGTGRGSQVYPTLCMVGFHLVGVRHLSYGSGGRRERELRCTGSKEGGGVTGLVDHQSMGLHGRGRVVQGIRVLRRLPL